MDLVRNIKCIICLVKCSKYLYFAKKLICFFTIMIAALMLAGLAADKEETVKKLKGLL